MKKIWFALLMIGLSGCVHNPNKIDDSISMDLYKHTHSHNELEKYKACILLGKLTFDAEMLNKIKKDANETDDICRHYLLAKRSGEFPDVVRYIDLFPSGKQQEPIWNIHFDAGFPVSFLSPYFVLMADQAGNNDQALDKLISGIPHADSSFGAVLIDTLADIYERFPERVYERLKAHNISGKNIKLITEISGNYTKIRPIRLKRKIS